MCGRFALFSDGADIASHFNLKTHFLMSPRYNIAPGQMAPVVIPSNQLIFCEWGFIPHWHRGQVGRVPQRFINAHLEGIHQKPAFKHAVKQRRCLVPFNGYFEWKLLGGRKQPYYFFSEQSAILAFAAIWDSWHSAEEKVSIERFTILTALEEKAPFVDFNERRPIFFEHAHYSAWLDPSARLAELLAWASEVRIPLSYYPVSTLVNNPEFDQKTCIQSL